MNNQVKLKYVLQPEDKRKNKPSYAWDILFKKYDIVKEIEQQGYYDIRTDQMMRNRGVIALWQQKYPGKSIPDNRNILKFDFSVDLPNVFKGYHLQIMPIGGNIYRIAPFNMYYKLKNENVPIIPMTSPIKMSSLDLSNVTTEPNAQTVAEITGMFSYVFHDLNDNNRTVVSTLSGKNNVQNVNFNVDNILNHQPITLSIDTWQAEIDGVYESEKTVLIIESKMKFPKDFNIRQLFIPRLLIEQTMEKLELHKEVYAGYFVKTRDIYILTVYKFTDLQNMNSMKKCKQYKFSLSDDPQNIFKIKDGSTIELNKERTINKIYNLIYNTEMTTIYPSYSNGDIISFPQANNLQISLDYLDLLDSSEDYITINGEKVERSGAEAFMDAFKYNRRQYNYYLNWLGYLGLVDRDAVSDSPYVTKNGKSFRMAGFHQQNVMLIKLMAYHISFRKVLLKMLGGETIDTDQMKYVIQQEMKDIPTKSQISSSTFPRRISSVKSMCNQVLTQMGVYKKKDG